MDLCACVYELSKYRVYEDGVEPGKGVKEERGKVELETKNGYSSNEQHRQHGVVVTILLYDLEISL